MVEYLVAYGISEATRLHEELVNARPGGVVRVSHPRSIQLLPRPERASDCKGCGAPLKAYIHHCEYCRRAAC